MLDVYEVGGLYEGPYKRSLGGPERLSLYDGRDEELGRE